MLHSLLRELHWGAVRNGILATAVVAFLIIVGSRNLQDFDSALAGYTFACLFMIFGLVYRYSVWLSKPPTRLFWRRGWQVFLSPKRWPRVRRAPLLAQSLWSQFISQDFIRRRNVMRWSAHLLIMWGTLLAAAITFPLVFGWVHFEQGAGSPSPTYQAFLFGFRVGEIPLSGVTSWLVFHGLVVSGFLVTPGVMLAMYRRMRDGGAIAVQRFARDFMPLILLFSISITGLLLWVSYEWLDGYFYGVLAHLHAITVIATLIAVPFGKLFHVFQRPASLGATFYRDAGEKGEQSFCPETGEAFAPKLQTDDLKQVLRELQFNYEPPSGKGPAWNEISPQGRRRLIARAHAETRRGRFA